VTVTSEARSLAAVLWDYHRLEPTLIASDVIVVLGSHDHRVAEHAASLWHEGWAPLVVLSGGRGKVTESWPTSEAAYFADTAAALGVPRSAMLLEEEATNTGENLTCTRALLERHGVPVRQAILVAKPYMARRAIATATKQWPEPAWLVSTATVSFAEYVENDHSETRTIDLMVGDLQRIKVYADQGFQTKMDIPPQVWRAYEQLVALGFDRYVLR
jgi:uncharacterized SAM-binding protein YcdF (DUF218 family)